MVETQVHQEAFELYYSMREKRSYKSVSERVGVSVTSVSAWGKAFCWQDRVQERDKEIAKGVESNVISKEIDIKTNLYSAINETINTYSKNLLEGKVNVETVRDLEILGNLWKELEGDSSDSLGGPTAPIFNTIFHGNKGPCDYEDETDDLGEEDEL